MARTDKLREFVLDIVKTGPELPQPMPDKVVQSLMVLCQRNEKELIAELFRISVRQAKIGIKDRINRTFDILEKNGSA